jgi:flagellar motility protein MotE (MotC chaperone)
MKKNLFLVTMFVTLLGGHSVTGQESPRPDAAASVVPLTSNTASPEEIAATPPTVPSNKDQASSGGCLTDPLAIEDLKHRREELETKQKELATKEADLKAREAAISDELKKLQQVRDDIAKIDTAGKILNDEKVSKLVETLETMTPKAASPLLTNIDESLAVAAMARMATPKLAKVLNIMEPGKASRLSELLAGVVRARNLIQASNGASAATIQSEKGGDNTNGQNNEQHSNTNNSSGGSQQQQRQPTSLKKGKRQG